MSTSVQELYGSHGIVARVLEAIPWSETDGAVLTASALFPFDQLHGRELQATQDHAARLAPERGAHLLDIGSGIGGPARYFASTFGCQVTGIDLTSDFVVAATDLSRFCGLSEFNKFIEADAAAMPFEEKTFDHAYCFYVGMNLPDRQKALAECFRVLKPGATLIWTEVTSGTDMPHYPLPWSQTADGSFVASRDRLIEDVTGAGFTVLDAVDETDAHLELANRMKLSGHQPKAEQTQFNEVILGPDFGVRRKNYITNLFEGRLASTLIVARKSEMKNVARSGFTV